MHSLQNQITLNQVMIVDILLLYAWYGNIECNLTLGKTVKMGGSVGFT
jgi:hypothetical protein